jgi:very-short-patch-repair endonuclease
VIDFCCVERRLAVEVDGDVHLEQRERDSEREALLIAAGFRVLRFSNEAVRNQLPVVLARIEETAREEPPARPAAPGRKAGWT